MSKVWCVRGEAQRFDEAIPDLEYVVDVWIIFMLLIRAECPFDGGL